MSTATANPATSKAGPRVDQSSFQRRRTIRAWSFLIPTLLVVAFVAIYPLAQTFYLSFTNARLGSSKPTTLVGFQNYVDLATDSDFRSAILLTVLFTVLTVVLELSLGL